MDAIVTINGKVNYSITLDPSVWIFDDRKCKMEDFFARIGEEVEANQDETLISAARRWDKALAEGSTPTKQSETLFVEKKKIAGDYGIPFSPFLKNAEVHTDAQSVICKQQNGTETTISLKDAQEAILCFAIDGKPIKEGGPIQLFFGNGRNMGHPITGIISFTVA
ncbi:hypothetical protein [Aneurinibacillus terranovensis]|uniref:hypothetical protein n=1 Tax=Aneurinibacillus terranovensis TaxID=278991 RepID=UPI00041416DE|nr:hypothetical protein [Aneurinibacillus terranovensis]